MKTSEAYGRHLTQDEIFSRVFPQEEGPAPVPLHLATCEECQGRVARLREGWLHDRGAVDGVLDEIPEAFWDAQAGAILERIADEPSRGAMTPSIPFRLKGSLVRRPILAFGSLAAALALVASISLLRPRPSANEVASIASTPVPEASIEISDQADDELLDSIDHILADEMPLLSIFPEGLS